MGSARRTWRAATLALLLPGSVAAQATVAGGERLVCKDGAEPVGSLGITGIACDRCQFFTNGKVHRAVFWTEPTILQLDAGNPAASVLQEGDILVAIDGELITTRDGSARFSALPPDRPARIRIRRDGRTLELSVPVAAACPTTKSAEAPVVAGRGVPAPPPPPRASTAPTLPRVGEAPPVGVAVAPPPKGAAAPVLPAPPPAPEQMAPRASLGFGFRCGPCSFGLDDAGEGVWSFSEPPEVIGLDAAVGVGTPALRPGDRLLSLDGVELTSDAGGRRFAAIQPGQSLSWTVERDGRRIEVTTQARERSRGVAAVASAGRGESVSTAPAPLRFSGTVGNTTIEVRGGRVNVTEDEGGNLVIIRTADTEIRIRRAGGEGR
jgi:hypothetical protein